MSDPTITLRESRNKSALFRPRLPGRTEIPVLYSLVSSVLKQYLLPLSPCNVHALDGSLEYYIQENHRLI